MYYWGNYPNTYYKQIKKADDNALENHKTELENIITRSGEMDIRVPPGVYAELGFIIMQEDAEKATQYFQLEIETYPESSQLMNLLIENLNK